MSIRLTLTRPALQRLRQGTRRPGRFILRSLGRLRDRVDPLIFPAATDSTDQWQRVVMNRAVKKHLTDLEPTFCTAAEISGDAYRSLGWKEHRSLNHPDFDLCAPVETAERFDVVICEQVLEHVTDPFLAVEHLYELCSPGGHAVVSTPFLIKVHELPFFGMLDYWRFTPRGLWVLLERAGFEVASVATWGNRLAVLGNLDRWAAHRPWLPLTNRSDLAVVVWAFARRPVVGPSTRD